MSDHVASHVTAQTSDAVSQIPVNPIIALGLAAFLVIVIFNGNLINLAHDIKTDLLGDASHKPFWRWALAFLVLAALADSPKLKPLFGPLFAATLVAMLIHSSDTGALQNLNSGLKTLFGYK